MGLPSVLEWVCGLSKGVQAGTWNLSYSKRLQERIMNEPSKWAIDAAKLIATTLRARDESVPCWELLIQKAIDLALSEKEREIAKRDKRISELEAQVDNLQTDVEGLCHMLKKEKQHSE